MDRPTRKTNRKPSPKNKRSAKNAGFIALMVLFALIIFAASNQPSTLKEINSTKAIADTNAGKYSKITVKNNQLEITPKGEDKPTLKTNVDGNTSLKEQGFDTSKVAITYNAESGGSPWISLAANIVPILLI